MIERRLPSAGERFVGELAAIHYVPSDQNLAGWKAGFEQVVQKLGEILVARTLFEAEWPDGAVFTIEPVNLLTGARPDLIIDSPERQWLFEVKCPAFIDFQYGRRASPRQLPVRSPVGDIPGMRNDATLPRDNVLKDFLESAERKFVDFSEKPRSGVLVVLWDDHVFEATSALAHDHAGLLNEKSWYHREGIRVLFDAVDWVVILNHLEVIKMAAQEGLDGREGDPFRVDSSTQFPNVWCPNVGCAELDPRIAQIFNAKPLGDAAVPSDYAPKDFVMWIDPAASARARRRARYRRELLRGVAQSALMPELSPASEAHRLR